MIKGALKLSDAQAKLWMPVEDHMRAENDRRAKMRADWTARGDKTRDRSKDAANGNPADRIERDGKRMAEQAARAQTFATVYRPFFDSLTAEQKAVAGPLMAHMSGGGRGHGHGQRWAGHHQDGRGHERHDKNPLPQ